MLLRRREEERQARLQRAREYEDAAWVQPQGVEGGSDSAEEPEEALDVADELYCVACDKFFKTSNAMANHMRCEQLLDKQPPGRSSAGTSQCSGVC